MHRGHRASFMACLPTRLASIRSNQLATLSSTWESLTSGLGASSRSYTNEIRPVKGSGCHHSSLASCHQCQQHLLAWMVQVSLQAFSLRLGFSRDLSRFRNWLLNWVTCSWTTGTGKTRFCWILGAGCRVGGPLLPASVSPPLK